MKKICIIPARGGSKRIPRKNIKLFHGSPIISYSIEVALESGLFDEVMVSTDDQEIAELSKSLGASVPFFRSSRNSDDFATTADVISEVLNEYENMGVIFDIGCCIYPTAPLISNASLLKSHDLMISKKYTTVFPIAEFSYPILRSLKINDDTTLSMIWPEHLLTRSQDLPSAYHDAGQFYWFNTEKFRKEPKLVSSDTGFILLDPLEVQDIDNEMDWKIAELKMTLMKSKKSNDN